MDLEIDRGDMKLLTEAGFSSVMRGLDVDAAAIFHALNEWMPQYAAGSIGLALQQMVAGDFAGADAALTEVIASGREGRPQAVAILALCKKLQNEEDEARKLADELKGTGGYAEDFTDGMVNGVHEETQGAEGLALETEADTPSRHGIDGKAGHTA